MKRTELANGGYTLTAGDGYDLVVIAEDGTERARTKEVRIPEAGTLNQWQEAPEVIAAQKTAGEIKTERIAALKAELAKLEDTSAVSTTE